MNSSTRRPLLVLLAVIVGVLCLVPAAPAAAAITVDSLEDPTDDEPCDNLSHCTLRGALIAVEEDLVAGDVTIEITVEGKVELQSEGELVVDPGSKVDSLAIVGPGAGKLLIDAEEESRGLWVKRGEVAISGLTVEHGHVADDPFLGADGGGALLQTGGTVTLKDVRFTENTVKGSRPGGGIDLENGDLSIADSTIDHNSTDSALEVGDGGGIHVNTSSGTLTLEDTTVSHNVASWGAGGGIYQDEGDVVVKGSTISENVASQDGGGITTNADGSHTMEISGSQIVGNKAERSGGGINTDSGAGGVTITTTTIAGNEAELEAGGVFVEGPTTITASTISGNSDGVVVEEEELLLETSTIAKNDGVGLSLRSGETEVHGTTISDNTGGGITAGLIGGNPTILVRSSIVAGNTGSDCSAAVTSEGHNILGTESSECTWPHGEGDQFGVDPLLGPLTENGGPTKTMAPDLPTSPAINHGKHPYATDQRGKTRPVPEGESFTDVGAVEVQAPVELTAPTVSPNSDVAEKDELHCANGTWDNDTVTVPESGYSFAWIADGSQIATGDEYTLKATDAGKEIKCQVTADNGATTTAATSAAVVLEAGVTHLSASSFDFGPTRVGVGSAPHTFVVTNDGGTAVTITSVTSSDATQFPVEAGDCTGGGGTLAPGAECEIEARFDPEATGAQESLLTVHSNAGSPTATLEGTGTAPELSVSPTSFDFGSRRVGSGPSAPKAFEVLNSGTAPETLSAAAIEGAGFAISAGGDGCEGETLQPTDSCTIEVVFEPTAAGPDSATLRIPGEDPTSATLSGTGLAPAFAANPSTVQFGARPVGSPATAAVVEISNSGSAPMQIGQLTIEGAGAGSFALSPSDDGCTGTSLEPGQTCGLEVAFAPLATGVQIATLAVGGNAPGTVALNGIGEQPTPSPTPTPPAPVPPAPPAPSSASIAGKPSAAHVGDAEGDVPLGIACDSAAGTPCQVSLDLLGGHWSGKVAAGATRTIDFPLTRAARKTLGERERMRVKAVLDVAGGDETTESVLLAAPSEGRLYVHGARRSNNDLLLTLYCNGGASAPRCSGRVTVEVPDPDLTLVAGEVAAKATNERARLPLTAAGRRSLDALPRPTVIAKAVIVDVYGRTETATTRFRLGE